MCGAVEKTLREVHAYLGPPRAWQPAILRWPARRGRNPMERLRRHYLPKALRSQLLQDSLQGEPRPRPCRHLRLKAVPHWRSRAD
jgi:hypothetical protein